MASWSRKHRPRTSRTVTFPRRTRAVSILGLGVLVSACSPPNEQPSERKIDTATSFAAAPTSASTPVDPESLPGVIECVGTPELRPDSLALACADDHDRLIDIRWSQWTGDEAAGTATRETNDCEPSCARGSVARTRGVEVELSEPVQSPQGLVFTRVVVDGQTIAW